MPSSLLPADRSRESVRVAGRLGRARGAIVSETREVVKRDVDAPAVEDMDDQDGPPDGRLRRAAHPGAHRRVGGPAEGVRQAQGWYAVAFQQLAEPPAEHVADLVLVHSASDTTGPRKSPQTFACTVAQDVAGCYSVHNVHGTNAERSSFSVKPSEFRRNRKVAAISQAAVAVELGIGVQTVREKELSMSGDVPDEWVDALRRIAARRLEAVDG